MVTWLEQETGLCRASAEQAIEYLADGRRTLGVIPTQETLVLERFFDESGGMQLVLHAPFGSRVNRAWTLALRKRFCRQFNFELQAAATEDALLLSLGPQHSFPLSDVFRYLHPSSVREILVQAFLDAPVFQTRWRWNTTISLAVPRNRTGRKVPPQLQRMQAEDLMAAVFPDAAACLENIPGDRQVPDHPLVRQTVRDCLEEAMDLAGLTQVLGRIHAGELRCVSRDTPEPSVFAHDILNARPYAFLDDAPLEERRTQAVQTRRAGPRAGDELGILDAAAIARVRDEERPDPRDAGELHEVLLTVGFLRDDELSDRTPTPEPSSVDQAIRDSSMGQEQAAPRGGRPGQAVSTHVGFGSGDAAADIPYARGTHALVQICAMTGRATRLAIGDTTHLWVAAERLPELMAVHPAASCEPPITPPPARAAREWTRDEALAEIVRGRVSILGPVTSTALAASMAVTESDAHGALLALEAEGTVLRGTFTPGARTLEWCDRRLLARIHRYTLNRLRAEISPVSPAELMRFLFAWQHVEPSSMLAGADGLRAVLTKLDGVELPARAWERHVLPARVQGYDASTLDMLCLTGAVGWARLSTGPSQVVGATPIALFLREHAEAWFALREPAEPPPSHPATQLPSDPATQQPSYPATQLPSHRATQPPSHPATQPPNVVRDRLRSHGASFAQDLAASCGMNDEQLRGALRALVAEGAVSSDGFAGLRTIVNGPPVGRTGRLRGVDQSGRWFELRPDASSVDRAMAVETLAWTLLGRYGIVFRRLLAREATSVPWRELARVYRRLEARGEIRGGRFVSGMSGEQFALPAAVERLREIRRTAPNHQLLTISGADPLNLTGILTSDDRVRASTSSRIVDRDGVPLAAMEGGMLRMLGVVEPSIAPAVAEAAAGRRVPVLSGYVGQLHR